MKTITPFDIESYPELFEYKDGYKDFLKKKLMKNQSVTYIENNQFLLGIVIYKDYQVSINNEDYLLKNFPYIKTVNGNLIPSTGKNALII